MEHDLWQGQTVSNTFRLSVAIPLYNEESVLCELLHRLSPCWIRFLVARMKWCSWMMAVLTEPSRFWKKLQ